MDIFPLLRTHFELRHAKSVIPKGGLVGTRPAKPSFGMTLTIKHNF